MHFDDDTPDHVEAEAEVRTPDEWRAAVFPLSRSSFGPARNHPDEWRHHAASAIHGWAAHEHHAGEAMALTEADYRSALDVASGNPPYRPHAAALSPHKHTR